MLTIFVFWIITLRNRVIDSRRAVPWRLKMKVLRSFETSVISNRDIHMPTILNIRTVYRSYLGCNVFFIYSKRNRFRSRIVKCN